MANPDFTIADVLAWARTKPADEAYDYCSNDDCAVAQFLKDIGRARRPLVVSNCWSEGSDGEFIRFDARIASAANGDEWRDTFGGLVTRLEALCPDQVIQPSEWARLDSYMTDELVSA